jgi:hypothetical protein
MNVGQSSRLVCALLFITVGSERVTEREASRGVEA